MGKLSALIGLAALAGVGYYVARKLMEKKNAEKDNEHIFEDDSEVFVEEKHSSPKEKLQKASLFAVGAIKTGTEKLKEGIDDILNNDMVSVGEETVTKTKDAAIQAKDKAIDFAKEKTSAIRTEIENIKNKVSSINTTPAEEADPDAVQLADAIKADVDEFTGRHLDMAEEVTNAPEARVRAADDEEEDLFNLGGEEVTNGPEARVRAADDEEEDLFNLGGEIIPSAVEEGKEAYDTLKENDEASKTTDELDSIDLNNGSVETFDFSSSDDDSQPL